jgi:protein gp37
MSTNISWVKNIDGSQGETLNIHTGCTHAGSPGCANCYAKSLHDMRHKAYSEGKLQNIPQYATPFNEVQFHPERLDIPLRRRKPTTYFINSMSDLFHESIPDEQIHKVFECINIGGRHTFIILTKRISRALEWMKDNTDCWRRSDGKCVPYYWFGTTVCNQAEADEKIPLLLQIPAAVRFVSIEPMLEEINLNGCLSLNGKCFNKAGYTDALDLVIAGCESGKNRRHINTDCLRKLRDKCIRTDTNFFLKQMEIGGKVVEMPELDGKVWDQLPERSAHNG